MNRAEREELIAKLEMENAAMAVDMAERKAARAARGEYDPIVSKSALTRNFDPGFDAQRCIDDQLWQQKNYPTPQPESRYVTMRDVDDLVDVIAEEIGSQHNALQDRIERLEAELRLVRAMVSGSVLTIEGKRNNAS
jgi:hypothetical protein